MNATLCRTTDIELDVRNLPEIRDSYATAPMTAILPRQIPVDEEALHMSFEEALSDRLHALHGPWSQPGHPAIAAETLQHTTEPATYDFLAPVPLAIDAAGEHTILWSQKWQRSVVYICLALMFMMIGFDLMGLLILHMH